MSDKRILTDSPNGGNWCDMELTVHLSSGGVDCGELKQGKSQENGNKGSLSMPCLIRGYEKVS